jgi:hypothetical protein
MSEQQQRIKDVGEVFTPQNIVNDMVDLLPNLRAETTVLEPSVGEGVFLCEILRRKLKFEPERLKIAEILQTLYGVDIMLDNVQKTRENLLTICVATCETAINHHITENKQTEWRQILQNNIRWGDTLACFEAKTENHNNIIYLKDLYREDLIDLQFFDYTKNKFEKYIFPINGEIQQQRQEYNIRHKPKQISLNF